MVSKENNVFSFEINKDNVFSFEMNDSENKEKGSLVQDVCFDLMNERDI